MGLQHQRDLPSVDALARRLGAVVGDRLPTITLTEVAREAIEAARRAVVAGEEADPERDAIEMARRLLRHRPTRVINATGVLLHTNLGRAPWHPEAADAAAEQAVGYGNVELDLETGARGRRAGYLRGLIAEVTGAPAALVVNNNAGALLLALAAIGRGRPAVVSRGELIEIGGSFRLPDLMAASGTPIQEVGTTNRTHPDDYAAAAPGAGLLLKVHPSNYRVEGFTTEVGYAEVAAIAHAHGTPGVADVGSGLLDTRVPWLEGPPPAWLAGEPGVRQTLAAGMDLVLFSGDKLLGGPQAGIAVGDADLIETMARHPLARALRIDAPTAAGLARTFELYASGRGIEIPFWSMASIPYEILEARHRRLLAKAGVDGEVVRSASVPGAGSAPGAEIPSPAIRIDTNVDATFRRLLGHEPPVVARRHDGALFVDLRAVAPGDDAAIAEALQTP